MIDNELMIVSKNEYLATPSSKTYKGKYTVGRFKLTDSFIIEYMHKINGIEIPNSWVTAYFHDISDINIRKIIYMECSDILCSEIMNDIRSAVESPPKNLKIYRAGESIVKVEII